MTAGAALVVRAVAALSGRAVTAGAALVVRAVAVLSGRAVTAGAAPAGLFRRLRPFAPALFLQMQEAWFREVKAEQLC